MEKIVSIKNESGLHARPATILVNQSNKFTSKINILHNGKQMDLKSIMGVMALGIPTKAKVEIIADGDDEKEAILAEKPTVLSVFDVQ